MTNFTQNVILHKQVILLLFIKCYVLLSVMQKCVWLIHLWSG